MTSTSPPGREDERLALVELVSELRAAIGRHVRAGRWAASAAASPRVEPAAIVEEVAAPVALGTTPIAVVAAAPTSVEVPSEARREVRREEPRRDARNDRSAPPSRGPGDPDLSRFDDIPVDDMGPPSEMPDFGDAPPGFGDYGGYGDFADLGPPGRGAAPARGDANRGRAPARNEASPSSSYSSSSPSRNRAPAAPAPALPMMPVMGAEPALISPEGEPLLRGKKTLATIRADLGDCQRCKLAKSRNKIVFGAGAEDASLVFVGEAPGADEDRTGEPFVGRAGQLLDKMIEAMGWSRSSVYIANLLKCRPPNNRNPEPDEAAACRPFLVSQLEVLAPRIIVALGRPSANALLNVDAPIGSLRGKFHERMGLKIMPTFHPAYLLRDPNRKRDAWADLQLVMNELARIGVAPRR